MCERSEEGGHIVHLLGIMPDTNQKHARERAVGSYGAP